MDDETRTAFELCCVRNDVDGIKLIAESKDISQVFSDGSSVTWMFLQYVPENPEILKILLENGAPRTSNSTYHFPPLMKATSLSKWISMRVLLNAGCNVNEPHQHQRAIDIAIDNNDITGLKLLLDAGANPSYARRQNVPFWVHEFMSNREQTRSQCICVLGLKRVRSRSLGCANGTDVLRIIARCVWETRGHNKT